MRRPRICCHRGVADGLSVFLASYSAYRRRAPSFADIALCHDKMSAVFAIFRGPGEGVADDADDDT
jgi:hypothetical protein